MLSAVLLILGSVFFLTANSLVCPPPEDVEPCICAYDNVFCHSSTITARDLEKLSKSLSRKGIFSLSLRNVNLGSFHLDKYKNLSISELKITDCKLESILDDNSKEGFLLGSYLKVLQIRNSINDTNGNFKMEIFSLKSLKSLEISRNFIPKLRSELFASTPITLKELTLKENNIGTVAVGSFVKMTSLEKLDLGENRIQNLTRSILPCSICRLKELNIPHNNITSLPGDFLWNMYFLARVNIHSNNLTELTEDTWSPVWSQLNALLAHGNPLNCDSRIEWMFKLSGPGEFEAHCGSPTSRKSKSLSALISENRKLSTKKQWARKNFMPSFLQEKIPGGTS